MAKHRHPLYSAQGRRAVPRLAVAAACAVAAMSLRRPPAEGFVGTGRTNIIALRSYHHPHPYIRRRILRKAGEVLEAAGAAAGATTGVAASVASSVVPPPSAETLKAAGAALSAASSGVTPPGAQTIQAAGAAAGAAMSTASSLAPPPGAETFVDESAQYDDNLLFGPIVQYLMSLDKDTNQLIENVIFGTATVLTLISLKVNFDEWQKKKQEEEYTKTQKIRSALSTDEKTKRFIKRDSREVSSGKGFRNSRRSKRRTPLQEVMEIDDK